MEPHDTATECHLPYGITRCYLYPTQVNTPRLNRSQTDQYSIDLPRGMEGWVDLDDLLHTEMVYPPVQVVTGPSVD